MDVVLVLISLFIHQASSSYPPPITHSGECPWGLHPGQQGFIPPRVPCALKALQPICLDRCVALWCLQWLSRQSVSGCTSAGKPHLHWCYVRVRRGEKSTAGEVLGLLATFVLFSLVERGCQTQRGTLALNAKLNSKSWWRVDESPWFSKLCNSITCRIVFSFFRQFFKLLHWLRWFCDCSTVVPACANTFSLQCTVSKWCLIN